MVGNDLFLIGLNFGRGKAGIFGIFGYRGYACRMSEIIRILDITPITNDNADTVLFDKGNGTGGSDYVTAVYGYSMPAAKAPTLNSHVFMGYFTAPNGGGVKYYNSNMTSARPYDIHGDITLYAHWALIGGGGGLKPPGWEDVINGGGNGS
jgi:hypothetical protein